MRKSESRNCFTQAYAGDADARNVLRTCGRADQSKIVLSVARRDFADSVLSGISSDFRRATSLHNVIVGHDEAIPRYKEAGACRSLSVGYWRADHYGNNYRSDDGRKGLNSLHVVTFGG